MGEDLPALLSSVHTMRIGVDVRCLMDGGKTGVEEYTLRLLDAMIAEAPDDVFICFANSRKVMTLPRLDAPNVLLRAYAYPSTLFNASLKVLRRPMLDRLVGGVDVFFVPSIRLAPLTAACPLVLTVHDLSFVRHPEFFSARRRRWHALMEPAVLAQRAAAIITVSRATARDVETLYRVPRDRIHAIPSGIPTGTAAHAPTDGRAAARDTARVKERYGLPDRFLLFLGTLEPRKNLDGLLQAYTLVRRHGLPYALVLAGVRGWIDEAFFERLRAHPFAGDIILTGFVEDADKPTVYRCASVFVYPSFYEGFGFPPLEALVWGTPVVTSYNSAIPEITGAWATLVNPYDPEELALALVEQLTENRRVPPAVGALLQERFSWHRAGRRTLDVLHAAAGPSREVSTSRVSR